MPYQYIRLKNPFRKYTKVVPENNEIIHGSYRSLLFDKRWKAKRLTILMRDLNRCLICQSTLSLQVHHRQYHFDKSMNTYKPPWEYPEDLLITLCEKCHKKGHRQHKVPTIYI